MIILICKPSAIACLHDMATKNVLAYSYQIVPDPRSNTDMNELIYSKLTGMNCLLQHNHTLIITNPRKNSFLCNT